MDTTELEKNIALSGDDARLLMITLACCEKNMPASMVINLWNRLNEISHVQPPIALSNHE